MKAVIDTCIIIDYLQKRQPFYADACDIIMSLANNQFDGYITAKSVNDIYYLLHRYFHDDKLTRNTLSSLFRLFIILDTTALDCQLAVLSAVGDYEDAVMTETAFRSNMDCIVTRNISDFKNAVVTVYSPQDFLKLIQ